MRTALIIPDNLVRELKRLAAERGQTLSAVVAEVMRRGLERRPFPEDLPLLTTHKLGRPKVNVADRDALHRAMEGV